MYEIMNNQVERRRLGVSAQAPSLTCITLETNRKRRLLAAESLNSEAANRTPSHVYVSRVDRVASHQFSDRDKLEVPSLPPGHTH